MHVLDAIRGGLVVSCQANPGEPMDHPVHIAALAASAEVGGAVGLRIDGGDNIRAARAATALPIIGIKKVTGEGRPQITPSRDDSAEIVAAGASVVAFDASLQYQPESARLTDLVQEIRSLGAVTIMADISTVAEAERAWAAGVDVVGTTLWGHTPDTAVHDGPGIDLAATLCAAGMTVIVEGHLSRPSQVREAFEAGALAVVVGTAITNPVALTRQFVGACPSRRPVEEPA
ncbi:N-acetylmannosamine-6-phosphate 2-epimerase [Jiangella muralis]|uniref:N-acetylmannosamine-6-phosphate 2-epimerase n=1 Tax=Jiangella muralis TaxID=702383 RepID=UPI00069D534D|nr:putative N-acetylmannosamine-6-phosphate 2-epimerase [Jiangella muralis]